MRFIQTVLAAISLSVAAFAAQASPANPQNGVDYRTLDKAQQTDSGKKVEVTEFFWYSCPHCYSLETALVEWVKKQGDNISFKRVPIAFRASFVPQQKLYYALEVLGKVEEMQPKVFRAIHVERQSLDTDESIAEFVAKQGIDKKKFTDVYNSFAVQTKVRRAAQLQEAYRVDGVPMLAVAGRYITSPSIVGASLKTNSEALLHAGTTQVLDWLVAKAAKENGAQAAAATAAPVAAAKQSAVKQAAAQQAVKPQAGKTAAPAASAAAK